MTVTTWTWNPCWTKVIWQAEEGIWHTSCRTKEILLKFSLIACRGYFILFYLVGERMGNVKGSDLISRYLSDVVPRGAQQISLTAYTSPWNWKRILANHETSTLLRSPHTQYEALRLYLDIRRYQKVTKHLMNKVLCTKRVPRSILSYTVFFCTLGHEMTFVNYIKT